MNPTSVRGSYAKVLTAEHVRRSRQSHYECGGFSPQYRTVRVSLRGPGKGALTLDLQRGSAAFALHGRSRRVDSCVSKDLKWHEATDDDPCASRR